MCSTVWIILFLLPAVTLWITTRGRVGWSWLAGIVGLLLILLIDVTAIKNGFYQFRQTGIGFLGMPLFYQLGSIPFGVLLYHFQPRPGWLRLLWLAGAVMVFLITEWITLQLGLFVHLRWSWLASIWADIGGFTSTLWLSEQLITALRGRQQK